MRAWNTGDLVDDEPNREQQNRASAISKNLRSPQCSVPLLSSRGTRLFLVFLFHDMGSSNIQHARDIEQERGAEGAGKGASSILFSRSLARSSKFRSSYPGIREPLSFAASISLPVLSLSFYLSLSLSHARALGARESSLLSLFALFLLFFREKEGKEKKERKKRKEDSDEQQRAINLVGLLFEI